MSFQGGGAVVSNDDGRLAVLVPVVNEPFQRRACKVRVLYLVILVQGQQIRRLVASHDGRFRAAAVERLPQGHRVIIGLGVEDALLAPEYVNGCYHFYSPLSPRNRGKSSVFAGYVISASPGIS